MASYRLRRLRAPDSGFVEQYLAKHRPLPGAAIAVRPGSAAPLAGVVALHGSDPVGLLLYAPAAGAVEIALLHTASERIGLAAALLREAKRAARRLACARLRAVVASDDGAMLAFYRRNGFRVAGPAADARVLDGAEPPQDSAPPAAADGGAEELLLELGLRTRAAESAAL